MKKEISLSENEHFLMLALSFVEGIGIHRANQLLANFRSAKNIFDADKLDLASQSYLSKNIIAQIQSKDSWKQAEIEIAFAKKNDIKIINYLHPEYPKRLIPLDDKPIVLYKKGNIHSDIKKSLAIVGTRKSSEYGGKFLEHLFEELGSLKSLAIISGMAQGIDYKAHTMAVKKGIPTVGVMGIALNSIFPAAHTKLAKELLEQNGGWITETSSQDKLSPGLFPRRNRIIAAMCDALFVVETNLKGGSMITAQLAMDYNKEIFALPGRYNDSFSKGCNHLIQNNMAALVNTPQDILTYMNWDGSSNKAVPNNIEIDFEGTALQKKLIEIIRKTPKVDIEKLTMLAGDRYTSGEMAEALITMELDGIIRTLPGNKYEIV
jgi:DNA processing protein